MAEFNFFIVEKDLEITTIAYEKLTRDLIHKIEGRKFVIPWNILCTCVEEEFVHIPDAKTREEKINLVCQNDIDFYKNVLSFETYDENNTNLEKHLQVKKMIFLKKRKYSFALLDVSHRQDVWSRFKEEFWCYLPLPDPNKFKVIGFGQYYC